MRKYFIDRYFFILCLNISFYSYGFQGQTAKFVQNPVKELRVNFDNQGINYVKLTFLNQVWFRFNESNPGTTVFGTPKQNTYDIGLRRTRLQLFGQLSDRVFFYTQIGQNNLSYLTARKQGLYFLDGITEYAAIKDYLSIGGGLTGWSGLSRYASPAVASFLSMDAPLYQQATNDVNDQFLRKYSVYAKGKIGKLDYRLAVSDPMSIQNSTVQTASIGKNSLFSAEPAKAQLQGYFMWQFLDKESNLTPYTAGTYLGKKRVFNIGAGFISQKNAMWHLADNGMDTIRTNMQLFAFDVFYDAPVNSEKGTALTFYACASNTNFGKNYVRNLGVMNPANGVNSDGSFNGQGSAFPILGTGSTLYAQAGYLMKKDLLGDRGTLQPYCAAQYSKFALLKDPMLMYEAGLNWIIDENRSKLSLNYQNRPIYFQQVSGDYTSNLSKGMIVLQYQIAI